MKSNESKQQACARCGRYFQCDLTAGKENCWCMTFPTVMCMPTDRQGSCYCRDCLAAEIENDSKSRT